MDVFGNNNTQAVQQFFIFQQDNSNGFPLLMSALCVRKILTGFPVIINLYIIRAVMN